MDFDVALTLGDPRGIGPEVSRKALALLPDAKDRILVLGPDSFAEGFEAFEATSRGEDHPGTSSVNALERAIELCGKGVVGGIVTGPIFKPALHEAGFPFPGHTEFLQDRTQVPQVGMLMAKESSPTLRVLLATTHLALRDVPAAVTEDLLVRQATLLAESLNRDWRLSRPTIALCAFNPHGSDSGLFGDEEERVYGPALERLADLDATIAGPVPADTVFVRALRGEFDAIVAPYHDVGMAGFKTASFGGGVNVTLGLPFVRTSPDHGTAFDIAGSDQADPSSMVAAIQLALTMVEGRKVGAPQL